MISGPTVPRNGDGLAQIVREAPQQLEGGLTLVQDHLVLGDGVVVDHLARDAVGRAVLVILASPGGDRDVPARLSDSLDWFDEHALALRGVMRRHRVRLEEPARAIVACFDLAEGTARRIRELGARLEVGGDRVSVLRLEPFALGGVRHVGVVPVQDAGRPSGEVAELPPALVETAAGPLARGFVERLERLDPELVVDGDRYRRSWSVADGDLAELRRRGTAIELVVPEFEPLALVEERDVSGAVDRVARRYLELLGEIEDSEHVDPLDVDSMLVVEDDAPPAAGRIAGHGRRIQGVDAGMIASD